jgi:DNA-binding phage protein
MPVKDYHSDLIIRLKNPEYAALYLKTALEETLQDGDREAFLLALRNVAEAQAETPGVADQSEVADERLPGKPTVDEAPTVATLLSVLDTAGLRLEFKSA